MAKNTLPIRCKDGPEKYDFGSFNGEDMLMWLKNLALEPWNVKPSHGRLRNQILEVRRILNASAKRPQRKRKFDQLMNDNEFAATNFGLISRENDANQQNAEKRRRDSSFSLSCSILSNENLESLQGTQGHVAFHALSNKIEYCSFNTEDYSQLSDCEESVKVPNPLKQGCLKSYFKDVVNDSSRSSSSRSTETSVEEEPNKFSKALSLEIEDDGYSSEASNLFSSEMEGMGVNPPRPVIPVGPRFQAEVSKWEGTTSNGIYHHSDDDLKWLGTQIWPVPDIKETNAKGIGKGRSDSCTCEIRGSIDCVKQHIGEARELLQLEIGTTFSSWKFDEMGQDVSQSWTFQDHKKFEYLVKLNPLSNDMDFHKLALERFPNKSMKNLINYYYNVYIPRRMSMETRSSIGAIDSDCDENENYKNQDHCSTTRMSIFPSGKFPRISCNSKTNGLLRKQHGWEI